MRRLRQTNAILSIHIPVDVTLKCNPIPIYDVVRNSRYNSVLIKSQTILLITRREIFELPHSL